MNLSASVLWRCVLVCSVLFAINCDELVAEKELNPLQLLADRPSELHIRSVAEKPVNIKIEDIVTSSTTNGLSSPPVSDSILAKILEASLQITSKKCREDIEFTIGGIRRNQHWALESKWLVGFWGEGDCGSVYYCAKFNIMSHIVKLFR